VTQPACPRCFSLAFAGKIRAETVMPIPSPAPPIAIEHLPENASPKGSPICFDCQAAENLAKLGVCGAWIATEPGGPKHPPRVDMPFSARRIAVGNERQEQLRLPPELRPHFGLVKAGLVRQTAGEHMVALEYHHDWLESVGIKLGGKEVDVEGRLL
jgi:hypothetical protein